MHKTKLMGVLNITPDSFSDGGKFVDFEKAVERGLQMQADGADIIDIGGESARPDADPVSEREELRRVIPVISQLKKVLQVPISIDTMKPGVALKAIEAGASIINDVSGFRDDKMIGVAAESGVVICCMHMLGTPKTMQKNPEYPEGVIAHLLDWQHRTVDRLVRGGIEQNKIILDPGIGFGKTVAHNLQIIQNLPILRAVGYPLLVGASKKSFMTKLLGKPAAELGAATLAVHVIAMTGADYIRAHDVLWHRDAMDMIAHLELHENEQLPARV